MAKTAIDTKNLTDIITEFRKITAKDAITPESLGAILQRIADLLATVGTLVYAPNDLSPQIYDMPVIPYEKTGLCHRVPFLGFPIGTISKVKKIVLGF